MIQTKPKAEQSAAHKPNTGGSTAKQTIWVVAANFVEHDVGRNSASLAYYLLFAVFPMLIFLSNLLGLLDLNVQSIAQVMMRVMPRDVVDLMTSYLEYVSNNSSPSLMWFSLVFTIYFPMRATKGLMDDVRRAYQLDKPKRPISYTIRQLIYTVVLLLVISSTLLFSTVGRQMLSFLLGVLPATDKLPVSDLMLKAWQYLRFLLVGVIMFAALGGLYAMAQDDRQPMRQILPGVVLALTAWLLVSVCFSFYVENFATYSIIYGTLGAVIVLLVWLYMTAVILVLGAEFNAALQTVHKMNENTPQE